MLDRLCLTGAVGWGRLSPHPALLQEVSERVHRVLPSSVAPVTFFAREDAEWMHSARRNMPSQESLGLGEPAFAVLSFLRERGASFFSDIVRHTKRQKGELESALWELVAAGLITADGFDNLRALLDRRRSAADGIQRHAPPRNNAGRWCLLFQGETKDDAQSVESVCWVLLKRYGVVFRELLTRESFQHTWRELLIALRRLEDRGEVRGGRFVNGFLGEQFALPVAVDSLRASRSQPPSGEVITISAADPLNLVGIIVPGPKVPAISGRFVSYRDGVAVDSFPGDRESSALAG
jgi:ATP-dependent Lhr-like helicase